MTVVGHPTGRHPQVAEAGYDLDIVVLERVMGKRMHEHRGSGQRRGVHWFKVVGAHDPDPAGGWSSGEAALSDEHCRFSRFDSASMRVVDEMVRRGWWVSLRADRAEADGTRYWDVRFSDWDAQRIVRGEGFNEGFCRHTDRRVAICMAALEAVAHETPDGAVAHPQQAQESAVAQPQKKEQD